MLNNDFAGSDNVRGDIYKLTVTINNKLSSIIHNKDLFLKLFFAFSLFQIYMIPSGRESFLMSS